MSHEYRDTGIVLGTGIVILSDSPIATGIVTARDPPLGSGIAILSIR